MPDEHPRVLMASDDGEWLHRVPLADAYLARERLVFEGWVQALAEKVPQPQQEQGPKTA